VLAFVADNSTALNGSLTLASGGLAIMRQGSISRDARVGPPRSFGPYSRICRKTESSFLGGWPEIVFA